jgi:large conductance mechanosensitive channel
MATPIQLPRGFIDEFAEFLKKYQVIGLAVAFIIGAAATKLVTATVNDLIMPIIAVIIPGGDWRASVINCIDFIIVALVIFLIVKFIMKGDTTKKI